MNETLYCENCEVNDRERKKAARTYGRWGLCDDCFVALGRPLLGAPRPVRQLDKFHVPALAIDVKRETASSDVITEALIAHGKISVNDVRKTQIDKEASVEIGWNREKMRERARLMQADRDANMSVAMIAAKYKVNVATVYNHTKGKGERPKPVAATNGVTKTEATTKPLRDGWSNENGHAKPKATRGTLDANGLLAKWNAEADAAFAVLPFEKKAELLASLEGA